MEAQDGGDYLESVEIGFVLVYYFSCENIDEIPAHESLSYFDSIIATKGSYGILRVGLSDEKMEALQH